MRKLLACATASAMVIVAGGCYRDFDFNGDAKAEHSYIDANGDWWDAETATVVFEGLPGDIPVPADYDGDHNWDRAVLRGGDWVISGSIGTISFPAPAQLPAFDTPDPSDYHILPVPADYDGDGSADPAWYRDSDGTWFIDGQSPVVFGSGPPAAGWGGWTTDQDYPVPADYDGDGTADLSTFNAVTRQWKVRSSIDGSVSTVTMEGNEIRPIPVPGDYDGVGHAQRAVVGEAGWVIEGHGSPETFGMEDFNHPALADYDGDNKVDLSYVSNEGTWKTAGATPSEYSVFSLDDIFTRYSIVTGHNLITNMPRLNLDGRCDLFPQFCS